MSAHILVVEDEPAILESVAYALGRDGFTVLTASTLAEAEARADQAELVVLDLMLPDGSGFDLIGRLRKHHGRKPVIVATKTPMRMISMATVFDLSDKRVASQEGSPV